MADSIGQNLKTLFYTNSTSSVNERKYLFSSVVHRICDSEECTNAHLKLLSKVFISALPLYRDGESSLILTQSLYHVVKVQEIKFLTQFAEDLLQYSRNLIKLGSSRSLASHALVLQRWICHLLSLQMAENNLDIWNHLSIALAYTLDFIHQSGDKYLIEKSKRKTKLLLSEKSKLCELLLKAMVAQTEDKGNWFCCLGIVVEKLTETRNIELLKPLKASILDSIVDLTIINKQTAPTHWLEFAAPFLKYITHDEFKQVLLPAIKKALLRSAETCIHGVCKCLNGLGIDLSQYVEEIVKVLAAPMISSTASLRDNASVGLSILSTHCSDPDAVTLLNTKVIGIYKGSEGKLTTSDQKLSVLQALIKLKNSGVTGKGPLENIATKLLENELTKMTDEVHEATKLLILKLVSTWASLFVSSIPQSLINFIKAGLTLKSATANVRIGYLQVALAAFKGNTLSSAKELIPLLQEAITRAKTQQHQLPIVHEGVCAATLLAKLSRHEDCAGINFNDLWNVVFEPSKNVLNSEKFLTQGSKDAMLQLLKLAEALFTQHIDVMQSKPDVRCWYRALLLTLLNSDYKVRHHAKSIYCRVVKSSTFSVIASHDIILQQFESIVLSQIPIIDIGTEDDKLKAKAELRLNQISPQLLSKTLLTICLSHITTEDGSYNQSLALKTLLLAHDQYIVQDCKRLWLKLLNGLGIDAVLLVQNRQQELIDVFLKETHIKEVHVNALDTLVSISSDSGLLDLCMVEVMRELNRISLERVLQEDYEIMMTPEGQLHDKTVIEKAKSNTHKQADTKRDPKHFNKLDLKPAPKKKSNDGDGLKLTKQQQLAYDATMEKETAIRNRLIGIQNRLVKYTTLLKHLYHCPGFLPVVPSLVEVLISLMQCPLAAPITAPVFISLGKPLFSVELSNLGAMVGHVTMRLFDAQRYIDASWCQTNLNEAIHYVIDMLHICVTTRNIEFLGTFSRKTVFSSSVFSYCLPFLRKVLRDRGSLVKYSEETRLKCLEILAAHCNPKHDAEEDMDMFCLPRFELLSLLSDVVTSSEGYNKDAKIQKLACSCIVSICRLSNEDPRGADGCKRELTLLGDNLLSVCAPLRQSSILGLSSMMEQVPATDSDSWLHLCRRVLAARFDEDESIAELAKSYWENATFDHAPSLCDHLLQDVLHPREAIRIAYSSAIEDIVSHHDILVTTVVYELIESYDEKSKIVLPKVDDLGRIISAPFVDPWQARQGIALTLQKISKHVTGELVEELFLFYVPKGVGDCNEIVRKHMLQAALALVEEHGKTNLSSFFNILQECLDSSPDSSAHDIIRQSVIILMGSCAKHLEKTDPRVKPILFKLMAALETPSQQVQEAVSKCIAPLAPAIKESAGEHVKDFIEKLLETDSYGARRGAAYGLAGLVKGFGIMSLKQQEIIPTLTEAIQNKKVARNREGALFAFETLCTMLGRLFEPYVVHLLPHLLLCFGDGNQYVREAADETAKAVMRNLSAHGVKLVLPSLLKALEEDSWRTKTGSVELLGAMAFCAPKQLSSCLPGIVPRLIEVLADSHMKVQKAGQQALKQIGGVIRNPEILEISHIILDALADPATKTVGCLQALLSMSFVHVIDAPSLALIMPILERALQQRSTETKKMAAQILGNMYALTEHKDLAPYLPSVVPGLKLALLDPSPEVRAVSARALGAMVKGMGEERFNDLLPWLLETLTSEQSSVDRSGAAQGLSEVLHGLGIDRLNKLMPDVIETTSKVELAPHVREGYLMLYVYLPSTFGEQFVPFIGDILPSILQGLADEIEYVRETSLKAGQRIINMYAETAVELLLPQLEQGLFDDNWRIRYSSMQLLGDLLFRISGVSGKMTTVGEEDDNFGTSHSMQAIVEILGEDRRNRVLAGLYMGRSDVALMVRQASLHVWKIVVQNTARTLRELLPTLFALLLSNLASRVYDKRQIAARTLGDLVRKLGERVLPEIIPILEKGLDSDEGEERQGVCIGLSEIMESTSRDMVLQFETSLITTVRRALCDPLPQVRLSAAKTFDRLHNIIGTRSLDGILTDVLNKLDEPEVAEFALDGLRQVMAVKSRFVLPFLVPKLISPPVNTKALAILSSVAGEAIVKHLVKILPSMMGSIEEAERHNINSDAQLEGTKTLVLSVDDDLGVRIVIEELLSASKHQLPGMRKVAAMLLFAFCQDTKADYNQSLPILIRGIFTLLNDPADEVVLEGWKTLDALIKRLDPSEQVAQLNNLRQSLRHIKADLGGPNLPGFSIPKKGITPVLPVFREGILNGSPDIKEHSATFLGEVIAVTSVEALKPSVLHITGPLIRILGDRFSANVKIAILSTLGRLLKKVGITLKPFLPQLQTTFLKSLVDSNLNVRQRAAWALNLLTILHARVDQLFTELKNAVNNNEDDDIRETVLTALHMVILSVGSKMSEVVQKALYDSLVPLLSSSTDSVREKAGAALGSLCTVMSSSELEALLKNELLDTNPSLDWCRHHGNTITLSHALFLASDKVVASVDQNSIISTVKELANADKLARNLERLDPMFCFMKQRVVEHRILKVPVCVYGAYALCHYILHLHKKKEICPKNVAVGLKMPLQHNASDVRVAILKAISYMAKQRGEETVDTIVLECILGDVLACLRDKNTTVKTSAEDCIFDLCGLTYGLERAETFVSTLPAECTKGLVEICKIVDQKTSNRPTDAETYLFLPQINFD